MVLEMNGEQQRATDDRLVPSGAEKRAIYAEDMPEGDVTS